MSDEVNVSSEVDEVTFLKEVMTKRFVKLIEHRKFCVLSNLDVMEALFDAVSRSLKLDDALYAVVKKRSVELDWVLGEKEEKKDE